MEDDVVGIAKTVAENYDDEELRDTFINISLDLYVLRCLMLVSHQDGTLG